MLIDKGLYGLASSAARFHDELSSTLRKLGFVPSKADYDLWMRISEKYIIAHVPESLTKVRVTGDNSSFIVNQEVWRKNWLRVMEKMQSRTQ